jgi:hypothetical protein
VLSFGVLAYFCLGFGFAYGEGNYFIGERKKEKRRSGSGWERREQRDM